MDHNDSEIEFHILLDTGYPEIKINPGAISAFLDFFFFRMEAGYTI